jgi:hypothetical protein
MSAYSTGGLDVYAFATPGTPITLAGTRTGKTIVTSSGATVSASTPTGQNTAQLPAGPAMMTINLNLFSGLSGNFVTGAANTACPGYSFVTHIDLSTYLVVNNNCPGTTCGTAEATDSVRISWLNPQLTLTLLSDSIPPSTPSQSSSTAVIAAVTDSGGNPLPNLSITFSAVPRDLTLGGHLHTNVDLAPAGAFQDPSIMQSITMCTTDVRGSCPLVYVAPEASGSYEITATAAGMSSLSDTKSITVGLQGLGPLGGGILILTGSFNQERCDGNLVESQHSLNHYGVPNLRGYLIQIAHDFFNRTGKQIRVNDMSLPLGGLFDFHNNWAPPHMSHRLGFNADVEWNAGPQGSCAALSSAELSLLKRLIKNYTGKWPVVETDHFHLPR